MFKDTKLKRGKYLLVFWVEIKEGGGCFKRGKTIVLFFSSELLI